MRNRDSAGFSLVEVMCAVVILAVGLVGMIQGINTGLLSSKEAELQTTAALLAAGRIETVRAEGYLLDGTESGNFGDELSLYQWTQEITPAEVSGLHRVKVVIEHSKTGKAIYELETMLFQPDLSTSTEIKPGETGRKRKEKGL